MTRRRDWRKARQPVRVGEVTDEMLAPARAGADRSGLAQTVWPSKWYGPRDFYGTDCLLTFAAAPGATAQDAPRDTAGGCATEPLLTVLPRNYYHGAARS
jgi:hypothetical protein